MEWLINDAAPVIAKILIVLIFPFSAIDKFINWEAALKQANSSFLPGGAVLLRLAQIVEFVTPVCIVFNWYAGWAAFVLAGYCAITGILYHNFWAYPRFWSPESEGYSHIWEFFKNFAIVGGCIFIMLGSPFVSEVEKVVDAPALSAPQASAALR
ncbi:MAG: DoxX family protein [Xanthobacteraceae bacterium]